MAKSLVIYHSADFDGIFCREIAKKFLGDNAQYVGWTHGDPPVSYTAYGVETVYILDLSPECIGGDTYDSSKFIWIDHHKSAIEKFPKTIPGYRIDGVAACRLAWQWFLTWKANGNGERGEWLSALPTDVQFINREVSEPLAVRLAGEYDIWDKRDPRAELFQHGLRSCEITSKMWSALLYDDHTLLALDMCKRGEAIQYAKTQENSDIITSYGFDVEFEGLTFLACNHARFNSHLFTAGIRPHHDALLGFKYDGKQWNISLYHIDGKTEVDLSLIAVKYGGGGHKGACGFRMTSVQMDDARII